MNLYCHSVMTFFSRIRKYFTAKNKKAVDYLRSGGRLGLWPMSGTNDTTEMANLSFWLLFASAPSLRKFILFQRGRNLFSFSSRTIIFVRVLVHTSTSIIVNLPLGPLNETGRNKDGKVKQA